MCEEAGPPAPSSCRRETAERPRRVTGEDVLTWNRVYAHASGVWIRLFLRCIA